MCYNIKISSACGLGVVTKVTGEMHRLSDVEATVPSAYDFNLEEFYVTFLLDQKSNNPDSYRDKTEKCASHTYRGALAFLSGPRASFIYSIV